MGWQSYALDLGSTYRSILPIVTYRNWFWKSLEAANPAMLLGYIA